MPVVKILNIEKGKLGIWKFRESSDDLQQFFRFTENEKAEFRCIKYENRKREFLSVRLLLEQMLGKKCEIGYNSKRKPHLNDNPVFISISHSADLAVVLLSEKKAGVDAENIKRNTEKVAKRFLADAEINDIRQSAQPNLQRIIYWCAKEAAFKFSARPAIEFKSQINIDSFRLSNDGGIFTGKLSKDLPHIKLAFHYFFYENNVVVYCVEVENFER